MLDAEGSIRKAFEEFSKIENVRILDIKEKRALNFKLNIVVWEINTEIQHLNHCINLVFHIPFNNHFPLELPKIYLSQRAAARCLNF